MQSQGKNNNNKKPVAKAKRQRPIKKANNGNATMTRSNAPVAIGSEIHIQPPKITMMKPGMVNVKHSEYIGDVYAQEDPFVVQDTFPINPGLRKTFPWLHRMARQFESYKFRNLRFRFETEAATSASGFIAFIPEFDPSDPAPATKVQAFQYENTVRVAPWKIASVPIAKHNLQKRRSYFTRSGAQADKQTFDVGNLFIASGGQALDGVVLGQIWVEYDIDFETPQQEPLVASEYTAYMIGGGTFAVDNPFGLTPSMVYADGDNLFAVATGTGGESILTIRDPGVYAFQIQYTGTSITAATCQTNTGVGAHTSFYDQIIGVGSTTIVETYRLTTTGLNDSFLFTASAATITASKAMLTPWFTP